MTPSEFAQTIRSKYPGAYDSIDDNTLAQKIVDKYPQYKTQVSFDAPKEEKGLIRKAAEAFVGSPIAPIAGGIFGGLAGAPTGVGAIGTAAAGAAGGEAFRQLAARSLGMDAPQTPFEAAKEIGVQGAAAAAGEGVGQVAMKVAAPLVLPAARRALGFASRFLKTDIARAEANRAAKIALEQDIIPLLGSPDVAFKNASALAKETGPKIGNVLKNIDFHKLAPDAEYEMAALQQRLTKGTERGLLAGAIPVINTVKETIMELYGRGMTAAEYNLAKNNLAGSINFLADNTAQSTNKKIVSSMANTIRSTVKKLVPDSFEEFTKNQKLFHAAELMKKALNDELGKQMGNNILSLPSIAAAGANLAGGNPIVAAASIPLAEAVKRRGTGVAANVLQNTRGIVSSPSQTVLSTLGFGQNRKKKQ